MPLGLRIEATVPAMGGYAAALVTCKKQLKNPRIDKSSA